MALGSADTRGSGREANTLTGPTSFAKSLGCAPRIASDHGHWQDLAVCEWDVTIPEFSLAPVAEISLTLNTGRPLRCRDDSDVGQGDCLPGQVCVIAPQTVTHFVCQGGVAGVSMHLSTRRLRGLLGDEEGKRASQILRTRLGFDDPFVCGAAQALIDEIRDPSERGDLYADAMVDAISLRLLRTAVSVPKVSRRSQELSAKSLSNIRERIEESLDTGVSLAELANEAGLSRHQFTRAFLRATGVPPHRYLTARRIERAKILLRQSDLSLVDVALSSGFSSQSHFCDRFRACTGTSPGRYRRKE